MQNMYAYLAVIFSSWGLRVTSQIIPTKNSAKNIEAH